MTVSRDRRLLNQSARALRQVSEWLRHLETVAVDGQALDSLGEVIYAVDEAEGELSESEASGS